MRCLYCNCEIQPNSKYCSNCGKPVNQNNYSQRYRTNNQKIRPSAKTNRQSDANSNDTLSVLEMKCNDCGAIVNLEISDRPILVCPYCMSKRIIIEDNRVTVQRIKSRAYQDVETEREKTKREIELAKQQTYKETILEKEKFKGDLFNRCLKYCIVCGFALLIGAILTVISYENKNVLGCVIGICITCCAVIVGAVIIRFQGRPNTRPRSFKPMDSDWIIAIAAMIFMAFWVVVMEYNHDKDVAFEQNEISEGKIKAGFHADFEDIKFEAAQKKLEALGFTNIECVDLNDSGIQFWKNGDVETVSINGDMYFDSGDFFYPDAKIVITHH